MYILPNVKDLYQNWNIFKKIYACKIKKNGRHETYHILNNMFLPRMGI